MEELDFAPAILVQRDMLGKINLDFTMMDTIYSVTNRLTYNVGCIQYPKEVINELNNNDEIKIFYLCGHGETFLKYFTAGMFCANGIASLLVKNGYIGKQIIHLRICNSGTKNNGISFRDRLNIKLIEKINEKATIDGTETIDTQTVLVADAPAGGSITTLQDDKIISEVIANESKCFKCINKEATRLYKKKYKRKYSKKDFKSELTCDLACIFKHTKKDEFTKIFGDVTRIKQQGIAELNKTN